MRIDEIKIDPYKRFLIFLFFPLEIARQGYVSQYLISNSMFDITHFNLSGLIIILCIFLIFLGMNKNSIPQ